MSYRLKNRMHVPPDGYSYREPETGEVFNGGCLEGTVQLVMTHRKANDIARPDHDEAQEDVEDQICKRVGGQWCDPMKLGEWGFSITLDKIQAGTKALFAWGKAAFTGQDPYVDQNEANRRADICSKCWANKSIPGCIGCGALDKLRELLVEAKGSRNTPYDDKLAACLVCGCSNAAQVWIKPEILGGAMSDHQRGCYAEISNCWKNNL